MDRYTVVIANPEIPVDVAIDGGAECVPYISRKLQTLSQKIREQVLDVFGGETVREPSYDPKALTMEVSTNSEGADAIAQMAGIKDVHPSIQPAA